MNTCINEKIFVYTTSFLYDSVECNLRDEIPATCLNKAMLHDFLSWGIKHAFKEVTGFEPVGYSNNFKLEDLYQSCRYDFEKFIFTIVSVLGSLQLRTQLNFNLVLTYERLYVITY